MGLVVEGYIGTAAITSPPFPRTASKFRIRTGNAYPALGDALVCGRHCGSSIRSSESIQAMCLAGDR